jgi:hypothetical protein
MVDVLGYNIHEQRVFAGTHFKTNINKALCLNNEHEQSLLSQHKTLR